MERITKALQKFPRVVVTADHGSSWLAAIANKENLNRTISWNDPDDWRYAKVAGNAEATDDFESVYRPDLEEHYLWFADITVWTSGEENRMACMAARLWKNG